jgi:hypothetical protein
VEARRTEVIEITEPRAARKPWRPEEDAKLVALADSKTARASIAQQLGRTVPAVGLRLYVLRSKKNRKRKGSGTGGIWSMKSDREFIRLAKTKGLDFLVHHFERSPKSVLDKAKRLGITLKSGARLKPKK